MNAKEWAEKLNGRKYRCELTYQEIEQMKQDGIVAVYGASDDLCELVGAVGDEVDCYDGGKTVVNDKEIRIIWHNEGNPCWTYETDIPHETFDIYEDEELYCKGVVFKLADCNKPRTNFERIKVMNTDELAAFLLKVYCAYSADCIMGISDCKHPHVDDGGCRLCFKEWLESEVIQDERNA